MTERLERIRKTPFRWWDLAVYGALLIAILAVFWVAAVRADAPVRVAEVYVDGALYATLDLSRDTTLDVDGRLVLTVRDGEVTVSEAHCADKLCCAMRISSAGSQIVCLPQSVVVLARDGIGSGEIEVGS